MPSLYLCFYYRYELEVPCFVSSCACGSVTGGGSGATKMKEEERVPSQESKPCSNSDF